MVHKRLWVEESLLLLLAILGGVLTLIGIFVSIEKGLKQGIIWGIIPGFAIITLGYLLLKRFEERGSSRVLLI